MTYSTSIELAGTENTLLSEEKIILMFSLRERVRRDYIPILKTSSTILRHYYFLKARFGNLSSTICLQQVALC